MAEISPSCSQVDTERPKDVVSNLAALRKACVRGQMSRGLCRAALPGCLLPWGFHALKARSSKLGITRSKGSTAPSLALGFSGSAAVISDIFCTNLLLLEGTGGLHDRKAAPCALRTCACWGTGGTQPGLKESLCKTLHLWSEPSRTPGPVGIVSTSSTSSS